MLFDLGLMWSTFFSIWATLSPTFCFLASDDSPIMILIWDRRSPGTASSWSRCLRLLASAACSAWLLTEPSTSISMFTSSSTLAGSNSLGELGSWAEAPESSTRQRLSQTLRGCSIKSTAQAQLANNSQTKHQIGRERKLTKWAQQSWIKTSLSQVS